MNFIRQHMRTRLDLNVVVVAVVVLEEVVVPPRV